MSLRTDLKTLKAFIAQAEAMGATDSSKIYTDVFGELNLILPDNRTLWAGDKGEINLDNES